MDKSSYTPSENNLIEEAYAATLDPTRLKDFERFWEAYIDAQLQNNPDGLDLENTPVNAHITLAHDILDRIKIVQEEANVAQQMVDSHYGFGFIVEASGRIIVANDTASLFTKERSQFKELPLDELAAQSILSWMKKRPRKKADKFKVFSVYLNDKVKKTWLLAPVKIQSRTDKTSKRYFLITSVDSDVDLNLDPHIIDFFGLTPAETAVTAMLCNGMTPKEIAVNRGVKIAAVRSQIVAIKDKTSARDIPDLIRIITTIAIRSKAVKSQLGRFDRWREIRSELAIAREMNIALSDGRNLQYFEQGHPEGVSILQIHSLISGVKLPYQAAGRLGMSYRMISRARAGYGRSDPKPLNSMNSRIDSCVEDLRQLLDHLGIQKTYLLTGWAGAIAQRFALKYPNRCLGLVLSGAVPVWEPSYLNSLQPRYRNMIKTSIHAPKAVPYLVRIAKALIDSGRSRLFISDLDAKDSVDKEALKTRKIYDLVERRFKFLVEQGVQAFVDDLPLIHSDWTEDAKRLKLPVSIIMGSENKDQPFAAIQRYKAAVPHADLLIIKGAGTYQNLTHFRSVIDAIESMG